MGVIKMLKKLEVTTDLYEDLLSYLMFFKQNRLGKIKARGFTNGHLQHGFISKEESSSPTVLIYTLIISYTMDTIEERKAVTCDIPGALK